MALDREYKIDAPTHKCQQCGRVFGVGDEYYSAVVETAEENRLDRHDFCPGCWKPEAQVFYSFWKTRVPEPQPDSDRGPRLVDMGRLVELFEHLAEATDVQAQRFRYVLALVLMRKRRLKILESRRLADGGETLSLRETGTDRRFTVSSPRLSEEEIRSVADRLREILDMPERWDQIQAEADSVASESTAEAAGQPDTSNDAESEKAGDGDA